MSTVQPPPVKPLGSTVLQKQAMSPRMTFPRVAHFSAQHAPVVKTPVHTDLIILSAPYGQRLRGGSSGPPARQTPSGTPVMNSRAVSSSSSASALPIRGTETSQTPQSGSRPLVWKEMPPPSVAAPPGPPSAATGVSVSAPSVAINASISAPAAATNASVSAPAAATSASISAPVAAAVSSTTPPRDSAQAPSTSQGSLVVGRKESPTASPRIVSAGDFLAQGMHHGSDVIEGKRMVDPPKVQMVEPGSVFSPLGRRRFTLPASSHILRPDFLPDYEFDRSKKKQFASRNRSPSPLDLPLEETSKKKQPYNTRSTPSLMSSPRTDFLHEGTTSVGSIQSSPRHPGFPRPPSVDSSSFSSLAPSRQPEQPAAGQAPHTASPGVAPCLRSTASTFKPVIRPSSSKSPGASGTNSPRSIWSQDSAIVKGIFQDNTPFKSFPALRGWTPHTDSSNIKTVMSRDTSDAGDSRTSPARSPARSPRNDSRNMNGILSPVTEDSHRSQSVGVKRRTESKNVSGNVAACLSPVAYPSDRVEERSPSKSPRSESRGRKGRSLLTESSQRSPSPWATDLEVAHETPAAGEDSSKANDRLSIVQKVELGEPRGAVRHRINSTTRGSSPERSVDYFTAVPRKGRQSPRAQMERVNLSPPPWSRQNSSSSVDDEVASRPHRNQNLTNELPPWARMKPYDQDPLLEAKIQLAKVEAAAKHSSSSSCNTPTIRSATPSASSTPLISTRHPSVGRGSRSPGISSERSRQSSKRSWLEKVHTRLEGAIWHAESLGPGCKAGQYTRSNESSRYDDVKSNPAQRPTAVDIREAERTTSVSSTPGPDGRERDIGIVGPPDLRNILTGNGGPPSSLESESLYMNRRSIHDRRRGSESPGGGSNASCSQSPYVGKRDLYESSSIGNSEYGFQYNPRPDMIGQAVDQLIAKKAAGENNLVPGSPKRRRPGVNIFAGQQTTNAIC